MSGFDVQQERDHVDRRRVVSAALIAFVGLAAGIVAAILLLRGTPTPAENPIPPIDTSLIVSDERGLDLRRAERAKLEHYGWVDRDAGLARIPVERAMDLVCADAGGSP